MLKYPQVVKSFIILLKNNKKKEEEYFKNGNLKELNMSISL